MKNTILEFGKFKGKKYMYVLEKHKDYCQWILENLDYKVADKSRKDFYDFLNSSGVSPISYPYDYFSQNIEKVL